MRVVATADNHLNRYYERMSPQQLRDRRQLLRDAFRAVIDYALQWPADVLCICGDLFDTADPRNLERSFVANCFAELRAQGITICAISGNHDTPRQTTEQGGAAPLEVYQQLGAIQLFENATRVTSTTLTIGDLHLAIGGLGLNPSAAPGSDPLARLRWQPRAEGADAAILLLHGQLEGLAAPRPDGAIFGRATLREQTDADVILLGDIHRPHTVTLAPGRMAIIPGATERMTFGEAEDVPGFVALEFRPGAGWTAQRHAIAAQPRCELTFRAEALPEQEIDQFLIDQVLAAAGPQTLVKLSLAGVISKAQREQVHPRLILDRLQGRVFACLIDTFDLLEESPGRSVAQRGVRLSQPEELRAFAGELVEQNPDPADQAITRAALDAILEHYR